MRRWIACRLEFKGRRGLRQPRRWTELFFLDEATALAAGHRPCAECRREDYRRWQAAWPGQDTRADAMDLVLHADRLDGAAKRDLRGAARRAARRRDRRARRRGVAVAGGALRRGRGRLRGRRSAPPRGRR